MAIHTKRKFQPTGLGVALITPFKRDLTIDFDALGRLIEFQIRQKTDFLVVMGTTGETPTLSESEKKEIRDFIASKASGRIPLVYGLGGNNTMSIANAMITDNLTGFDAILSVVPMYNKPTQEGIFRHFEQLAQVSPLPLILYNVPGRTGVNMKAETTLRLAAQFPNIIAVKEASGDIFQTERIIRHKPEGFGVLSGDDGLTYPLMTMGACGVISVIGNALPSEFGRMVRLIREGKEREARDIHLQLTELFSLIFTDGNPAGVKEILSQMGFIENVLRLPLTSCTSRTASLIRQNLQLLKESET